MEPHRDADRSVPERARELLARMTLEEKLAQLGCVWSTQLVEAEAFSETRASELLAHGIGHVTRIGGSTGLRPREVAEFTNRIQRHLRERTRLGIPAIVHEESCAGLLARDATQFPQALGLAASFDPELCEAVGGVIREQMRAVGARQTLAPVLDVTRDPRWGRAEETFGEDPYLVSRMGVAYVRGVQGGGPAGGAPGGDLAGGVAATGKHFVAYGAAEGGLNHAPAQVGPRALREVYARPFAAAIHEAGLASVMNAYNEVDGLPCGGSRAILDDLLRGELGFDGLVVSDYFTTGLLIAFHRVAADRAGVARVALEAGLDMELPARDCYGDPLRELVERGELPVELVDRSVLRVLRLKLALGLFEAPYVEPEAAPHVYQTAEQTALARRAAAESLVLLRNEGGLLPLARDVARIAVIGPAAADPRLLQGDYSYPAHLEILYARGGGASLLPRADAVAFRPGPYFPPTVTLLEGIRAAVSDGTAVEHVRGCDVGGDDASGIPRAVEAARGADVAVVAVGARSGLLEECSSGEFRDSATLTLPGVQEALALAVVATGTPTVVVIVSGRVHALPRLAERVPALLLAWLPGQQGGAGVADVLFGAVSPSGRLPISLPRHAGQVPVYHGHKSGAGRSQIYGDYVDCARTPLFAFGHGLSYTRFEYAGLEVRPERAPAGDGFEIAFQLTNAGECEGCEVVQLYARDLVARVTRPARQLVGFARVALGPGESRRVVFRLDPSQLAYYDERMRFVVEPGEFEILVGAASDDLRLEGRLRIEGEEHELCAARLVPTSVRVE